MLNSGREAIVMTNGKFTRNARLAMALTLFAALLAPAAATAQIRQVSSSSAEGAQTVNFTIGYFALKALDSRVTDDVLLNNLQSAQPLVFEIKDFNSATFGVEYLVGVGSHFEAGVGAAYSQRTVPSVYRNLTHADQTEIAQDLKLRQIPVSFTGRLLLLPRGSAVEPYIGAGIVAIRWRYSETGEFVADDNSIFPARFFAEGTAAGPTVLGGIRAPIGNWTVGGEARWQRVEASKLLDAGFLGDKLDLGGWTANFTFGVRF
jgi:opacity protein-like surface antigen